MKKMKKKKLVLSTETLSRMESGVYGGDDDIATIVDNDCWRPTQPWVCVSQYCPTESCPV